MRYRGEYLMPISKECWLKEWNDELVSSGYYFVLNVDYIRKQLTKKEMTELTPKESAWIYINLAKEVWSADKSGG